ncbi:MAG: hypothetical protein ABI671_03475 [Burkholderiales bacterium]
MKLRAELFWTILVQGCGAVAAVAALGLLGAALGPASQGLFSRTKAEIELVAAFATLGLPQSLFFHLRQRGLSLRRATSISVLAAMLSVPASVAYISIFSHIELIDTLMFVAAAFASVLHANIRAVSLAVAPSRTFNIVTAVPQFGLLAYSGYAAATGAATSVHICAAIFASMTLGSIVAARAILKSPQWTVADPHPAGLKASLVRYGAAAGVSSMLFAASTLICLRVAEQRLGATSLGVFSMSLALAQTLITPLNYTLPLLFKHWTRDGRSASAVKVGLAAATLPLVAALAFLALRWTGTSMDWLGQYSAVSDVAWLMLLAISAESLFRVVSVGANAHGRPWLPVVGDVGRVAVLVSAFFLFRVDDLTAIGATWLLACFVSAGILLLLWWSSFLWPARRTL